MRRASVGASGLMPLRMSAKSTATLGSDKKAASGVMSTPVGSRAAMDAKCTGKGESVGGAGAGAGGAGAGAGGAATGGGDGAGAGFMAGAAPPAMDNGSLVSSRKRFCGLGGLGGSWSTSSTQARTDANPGSSLSSLSMPPSGFPRFSALQTLFRCVSSPEEAPYQKCFSW